MHVGKDFRNGGRIDPYDTSIVSIGDHVILGDDSRILTHCPIRYTRQNNRIVIDDLVWIGFRCIILPGVHIAKGTVVGAGSVVTKDTDKYDIIAGNPARFIKKREGRELIKTFITRFVHDIRFEIPDEEGMDKFTIDHFKYLFDLPRQNPVEKNDPCYSIIEEFGGMDSVLSLSINEILKFYGFRRLEVGR
jgi:hypothetical protein